MTIYDGINGAQWTHTQICTEKTKVGITENPKRFLVKLPLLFLHNS
jgi:hypothetical protein